MMDSILTVANNTFASILENLELKFENETVKVSQVFDDMETKLASLYSALSDEIERSESAFIEVGPEQQSQIDSTFELIESYIIPELVRDAWVPHILAIIDPSNDCTDLYTKWDVEDVSILTNKIYFYMD